MAGCSVARCSGSEQSASAHFSLGFSYSEHLRPRLRDATKEAREASLPHLWRDEAGVGIPQAAVHHQAHRPVCRRRTVQRACMKSLDCSEAQCRARAFMLLPPYPVSRRKVAASSRLRRPQLQLSREARPARPRRKARGLPASALSRTAAQSERRKPVSRTSRYSRSTTSHTSHTSSAPSAAARLAPSCRRGADGHLLTLGTTRTHNAHVNCAHYPDFRTPSFRQGAQPPIELQLQPLAAQVVPAGGAAPRTRTALLGRRHNELGDMCR